MESFIENQLKLHQANACYLYEKKSAKTENAKKQKKKKWMILDGEFVIDPSELAFSMIYTFVFSAYALV